MKLFNLAGWLINLDNEKYLFYTDKPHFAMSSYFAEWSIPWKEEYYIRFGWECLNDVIHIELTPEESKALGLPITEPYYYIYEEVYS